MYILVYLIKAIIYLPKTFWLLIVYLFETIIFGPVDFIYLAMRQDPSISSHRWNYINLYKVSKYRLTKTLVCKVCSAKRKYVHGQLDSYNSTTCKQQLKHNIIDVLE